MDEIFNTQELRHFKEEDDESDSQYLPAQLPTVTRQVTTINVSGDVSSSPAFIIKLAVDAAPGCGGIAWPAGRILAKYLSRRKTLRGLTVVELGSGTGLVGITAGMMMAKQVWITDQEPLLDLMRTNVCLNELESNVNVLRLDWGLSLPAVIPSEPDLILAADCVYFEPAFPLLVKTLSTLSMSPKTEILFCYKKRRKADKRFFGFLKKEFSWSEVMDDPCREEYARDGIFLYRLSKRGTPK